MIHALLIGIVAGLRSMIAPAAVAYALKSGLWILFAVLAIAELIGDKLPRSPSRLIPPILLFRCVSGAASAYFLVRGEIASLAAIILGLGGALIGAAGGYYTRRFLTRRLRLPDAPVALGEDILAIFLAFLAVM